MRSFLLWLREWDYRPLARLLVWCGLACATVRHYRVALPEPAAVLRELVLGWLLSFGLLTWIQLRLAAGAWCVFMALDDWTYALSERVVRPLAGRASFAAGFLVAHVVQVALVIGTVAAWRAADAGPRLLALLAAALRATCG